MAARIEAELGVDVELEAGRSGEYSVWVGERRVARKLIPYLFPADDHVVARVRKALARGERAAGTSDAGGG